MLIGDKVGYDFLTSEKRIHGLFTSYRLHAVGLTFHSLRSSQSGPRKGVREGASIRRFVESNIA